MAAAGVKMQEVKDITRIERIRCADSHIRGLGLDGSAPHTVTVPKLTRGQL